MSDIFLSHFHKYVCVENRQQQPCVPMTLTLQMIKVKTALNFSSVKFLVNILKFMTDKKWAFCRYTSFLHFLVVVNLPLATTEKKYKGLYLEIVLKISSFLCALLLIRREVTMLLLCSVEKLHTPSL